MCTNNRSKANNKIPKRIAEQRIGKPEATIGENLCPTSTSANQNQLNPSGGYLRIFERISNFNENNTSHKCEIFCNQGTRVTSKSELTNRTFCNIFIKSSYLFIFINQN